MVTLLLRFVADGVCANSCTNRYKPLTRTYVAPPAGFEPATVRLEGGCSNPLSYGGGAGTEGWEKSRCEARPVAGRMVSGPQVSPRASREGSSRGG